MQAQRNRALSDVTLVEQARLHDLGHAWGLIQLIVDGQININNADVRRSLTHNILSTIVEYVLARPDAIDRPIFIYNTDELRKTELFEYVDGEQLLVYMDRLSKKLMNMLGVVLISIPTSYDVYVDELKSRDGEAIDRLYQVLNKSKPRSLYELHKFVLAQGLTSLQDKFFNSQHFKKILI